MTITPANASASSREQNGVGNTVTFDEIREPGTYVCNWSVHLLRIPEDAVKPGRSPVLQIRGKENLYVTKISADPFVPLTKARMICSDLDQAIDF